MNERRPRPLDIGRHTGAIAVIVLASVAIVGLAWLFVALTDVLLLIFAALVLAVIFSAMADWLCRRTGMKRGLALALCVVTVLAVFVAVFWLFGAQLASEFATIRASIPPALELLEQALNRAGLGEPARRVVSETRGDLGKYLPQAGNYVLTAGSVITNVVLLVVGAIFIASDPALYRRGFLLLMPRRAEDTAAAALDDASRGLRGWIVGQALSSSFVALVTWGGLSLIGVPAAGGLGVLAGLLDFIPMIGPIIAAVPAVLLAFTASPTAAGWTVGLFLFIQQLQGNILLPMIQEQAVNVPPAVLLFAIFAAGSLFGIVGVILAAPLTVVVHVMVQRIYVRTLLGKPVKIVNRD
jgi:predicted PurR-regulated permease PerM